MQKIYIIGGDRRQQYMQEQLKAQGFVTYSFGLLQSDTKAQLFKALSQEYAPCLLLPLPLSRDGSTVYAPLAAEPLSLREILENLPPSARLLGFGLPTAFCQAAQKRGAETTELFSTSVVEQNAKLTAKAAVPILERRCKCPLLNAHVGITGFGHVAKALVEELLPKTARLTVFVRSEMARQDAKKHGVTALPFSALPEVAGQLDSLCNTVPAPVVTAATLQNLPEDTPVLELASKPYGVDFAAAEQLRRTVVRAPGLPGKYFPCEAAAILTNACLEAL